MARADVFNETLVRHLANLTDDQRAWHAQLNDAGKAAYARKVTEHGPGIAMEYANQRAGAIAHNIAWVRTQLEPRDLAVFDQYGHEAQWEMSRRVRDGVTAAQTLDAHVRDEGDPPARETFQTGDAFRGAFDRAWADFLEAKDVKDGPDVEMSRWDHSVDLWGRPNVNDRWRLMDEVSREGMEKWVRDTEGSAWEYQVRPDGEGAPPNTPVPVRLNEDGLDLTSYVVEGWVAFRDDVREHPRVDLEQMRTIRMERTAVDVFRGTVGSAWLDGVGEDTLTLTLQPGVAGGRVQLSMMDMSMDGLGGAIGVENDDGHLSYVYGEKGGSELVEKLTGVPAAKLDALEPTLLAGWDNARDVLSAFPSVGVEEREIAKGAIREREILAQDRRAGTNQSMHDPAAPSAGPHGGGPAMH